MKVKIVSLKQRESQLLRRKKYAGCHSQRNSHGAGRYSIEIFNASSTCVATHEYRKDQYGNFEEV